MKIQRRALGFFSGMALFLAFLYVYPIQTQAPLQNLPITASPDDQQKVQEKEITFSVLDQGEMAPGAKSRKNYAIYTQEEFDSFWELSHASTETSKAPKIDFKKNYVVVVFAGTQPTTGYKIKITNVRDVQGERMVAVAMLAPGEGCKTKEEKTSPYQFVSLPFDTESSLSHSDVVEKVDCK